MFGAKRSGIPVPGTAARSSIPVVKKTNGKTNPSTTSQNASENPKSSIPSPTGIPTTSPGRSNGSKTQVIHGYIDVIPTSNH